MSASGLQEKRWIRPAGKVIRSGSQHPERARPWVGTPEPPQPVRMGLAFYMANPIQYILVRCVDPCGNRGLEAGQVYEVRASFVHEVYVTPPRSR